jgi:hypothetical protein
MSPETEHYHLDSNLTLSDASPSPLTVRATNLSLTKQEDQLLECRLTLSVNPELYQRIDTQSLFNLKPELRGSLTAGEFISESNIEITASIKPDLLTHLTPYLADVSTYIKTLSQEQPENPLLSTESWLALQVKQLQTGYRTFWDYLSPEAMTADSIDSEKLNDAIVNFFKDWAEVIFRQ